MGREREERKERGLKMKKKMRIQNMNTRIEVRKCLDGERERVR